MSGKGAVRAVGIGLVFIAGYSITALTFQGTIPSAAGWLLGLSLGGLVTTIWWKPAAKVRFAVAMVSAVAFIAAGLPLWVAVGRSALAPPTCGLVIGYSQGQGAADCFNRAFKSCTPRSLTETSGGTPVSYTDFLRIRNSGDNCVIDDHIDWISTMGPGEADVTCTGIAGESGHPLIYDLTGCNNPIR